MILHVRLFARARDLGGADTLTVELSSGATVAELRRRIAALSPSLASLLSRCAVAVNSDFAEDGRKLAVGDEVAVLPPVSGGSECEELDFSPWTPKEMDLLAAESADRLAGDGFDESVS